MTRRHFVEVDPDTLEVKDAYTLVNGKRIKPPNLNPPLTRGERCLACSMAFGCKGEKR
jgi:hypothetical protein